MYGFCCSRATYFLLVKYEVLLRQCYFKISFITIFLIILYIYIYLFLHFLYYIYLLLLIKTGLVEKEQETESFILTSTKRFPWFYEYNHHDYNRHFSYYWAKLTALSVTHPSLYEKFVIAFSINRAPQTFYKISQDHAIEQTINKDKKEPRN